jgi:hypothetical protein
VKSYDPSHDVNDYRREIRSRSNGLLGWFNPKEGPSGKTHDRTGNATCNNGDIRAKLIPPAK